MTRIGSAASHRTAAGTRAALTAVHLRARIGIIAVGAIRLCGIGALSGRTIAYARHMALVRGRTRHRITAHAGSVLAAVAAGTFVAITAVRIVRLDRIRALPCGTITNPRVMALI